MRVRDTRTHTFTVQPKVASVPLYPTRNIHLRFKKLLCVAAGVGSFLLYSVHEGIRGIPLDPSDKSDALVPVSGTSLAVGIDFHAGVCSFFLTFILSNVRLFSKNNQLKSCTDFFLPDNDTIYWVDMGLSTISRAKRDQTWREDVVTNGIGRVEGIAVDWIAGEALTRQ